MHELKTAIEFVLVDSNQDAASAAGSQTGDLLLTSIIACIAIMILSGLLFCFAKSRKLNALQFSKHSSTNHISQRYSLLNSTNKKHSIFFVSLIFFMALICCVLSCVLFANNPAFAQNPDNTAQNAASEVTTNAANNNTLQCKDKVIAYVNKETQSVNIENGYIYNGEDNCSCQLTGVALLGDTQSINSSWLIANDQHQLYSGPVGMTIKIEDDNILSTGQSQNLYYKTDMNFEQALPLCSTSPFTAVFKMQKIYTVDGKVIDEDGNAIQGAEVSFNTTSTNINASALKTATDENGYFKFSVPEGTTGQICIEYSGKSTAKFDIGPVTDNIHLSNTTLYGPAVVYGTLTTQQPSYNHQFDAQNTQVNMKYINPYGLAETKTTDLSDEGEYRFEDIPFVNQDPITVTISCRRDGYYFQVDAKVDSNEVEVNGVLKCGLDNYTIEELTYISDDISQYDQSSGYYNEFIKYMQTDELWFSNSNGSQTNVTALDTTNFDPTKCNQNYKNNFAIDESIIAPENKDKDQFVILRLIGVNQDDVCNTNGQPTGKKAGLTLQCVRSLPQSYQMSKADAPATWWGDIKCTLRQELDSDTGNIFSNLCQPFKDAIVNVAKKSQTDYSQKSGTTIKSVADKMFCLSYTEMYTADTQATRFNNNDYYKNSAEGDQYQWYKLHSISGKANNDIIANLGTVNSGEAIAANNAITYQRTPYYQAQSMYLTTNAKGAIYTYESDASNKNGVAPAFSLATSKCLNKITFDTENVSITDTEGNKLSSEYYCVNHNSLNFKVIPDAGYTLESVMCDGEKIEATGDTYTIADIVANHTITVKLGGAAGETTTILGTSKLEKNGIGEQRVTIENLGNIELKAVGNDGTEYGKITTDENGQYRLICDSSCVGKTGYLISDARPGVLEYKSEQITYQKGIKITIDPIIHGLDYYTISELQSIGGYLSSLSAEELESNKCYQEFHSYLINDVIWYSNSRGLQPKEVNPLNTEAADTSKCNAEKTKCNFVDGDSLDNYLFLRIIGIRHDPRKDGALSGYCGLTMQTVRALPMSFTSSSKWWGEDSGIRDKLKRDGEVFGKLNQEYRTWAVDNKKLSQKQYSATADINTTEDWMFVPSYSEIWATNGALKANASWYDNGSEQTNTEGKLYEWYKNNKINGGDASNKILEKMSITNSGNSTYTDKGTTWLRSIYFDNTSTTYHMAQRNGYINSYNYDFSKSVICPCICF